MGFPLSRTRPGGASQIGYAADSFAASGVSESRSGLKKAAGRLKRIISKQSLSESVSELHHQPPNRPLPAPLLWPVPATPRPPSVANTYRISYDNLRPDPRSSSQFSEQKRVDKVAFGYTKVQAENQEPAKGKAPYIPFHPDDYWQLHERTTNRIAELPGPEPAWPQTTDRSKINPAEDALMQWRQNAIKRRPLKDHTSTLGKSEHPDVSEETSVAPERSANEYLTQPTKWTAEPQELHSEVRALPHKTILDKRGPTLKDDDPSRLPTGAVPTKTTTAAQPPTSRYISYNPQTARRPETLAGVELRRIIDDTWSKPEMEIEVPAVQHKPASAYTESTNRLFNSASSLQDSSDLTAKDLGWSHNTETTCGSRLSTVSWSMPFVEQAEIHEIKLQQARTVSVKPHPSHKAPVINRLARPVPTGGWRGEPLPRWGGGGFRGDPAFAHSKEYRRRKRQSRELENLQREWEERYSGDLVDFRCNSEDVEKVCAQKQFTTTDLLDFWENQK